jgi:hypothetical protein
MEDIVKKLNRIEEGAVGFAPETVRFPGQCIECATKRLLPMAP